MTPPKNQLEEPGILVSVSAIRPPVQDSAVASVLWDWASFLASFFTVFAIMTCLSVVFLWSGLAVRFLAWVQLTEASFQPLTYTSL